MASLTIELTTEAFERLRAEAQRQGKAEAALAQELLTGQLLSAGQEDVPLYLRLKSRIHELVASINPDAFIIPGKASREEAIALLRSWTEEDAAEDEGDMPWEDVLRSIDAHRTSYRKLFPYLEQSE